MPLSIHLLGGPQVAGDGGPVAPPRGHKVWALLAYLVMADVPPSREQLVALLFAEADDPLAALRWNLTELRRVLRSAGGDGATLAGDPVRLSLPVTTVVDVDVIRRGAWSEALRMPGLGQELLAGVTVRGSPAFDMWLMMERRHLAAASEGVLRESALARLATGDARQAVQLAGRLVALNPLEEASQTLLVRSLAAAGDGIEAARQVARCTELFERELGASPSAALAAAARTVTATPTAGPVARRAAARAQLEAGQAAIAAGVLEAGLDCLRRARVEARAAADPALEAQALAALGEALVHAARGRDDEGATALHEALALARETGQSEVIAGAARELGYVEFLRGRYERALAWAERAGESAADDRERGRLGCLVGCVLTDTAYYGRAVEALDAAWKTSEDSGDTRQAAYTLAMLGRAHLLRGETAPAAEALERSIELARADGWTSFLPWPEAFRADVDLARGSIDAAAERYEYAFALGCQLADPCWEAIAARGLGVVAAARGDVVGAVEWLLDALRRGNRLPDAYVWVEAHTLDALCEIGVTHRLPSAGAWVEDLTRIAERGGMRELIMRAHRHRGRLGDRAAADLARLLASKIDNPVLHGR
ncbi:hypothetical protein J5X84_26560 [Streptosporangiaceae bacterium NEAU-GS5]|nr:hypothetical protein [Streptosporangiaceae bacterium NEAU-GS5]